MTPKTPTADYRRRSFTPGKAGTLLMLRRTAAWLRAWALWEIAAFRDRWRGPPGRERSLERAGRVISTMGPYAAWVGRQFAMRLDLVSLDHASVLAHLDDSGPPMDLEIVVTRVEAAVGHPLDEVFAVFDPVPIRAEVTACVYQAELTTGERVAVRVQRPEAARRINAERLAIGWIMTLASALGREEAGALDRVRQELKLQLLDNLDYVRVGRVQELMRRSAKERRFKDVVPARVHIQLSDENVLVTEFARGVWLHEVIAAVQGPHPEVLARLADDGIDPERCATRLLQFSWWAAFENYFVFAAPYVGQIVVQPGGRMLLVDIGMAVAPPLRVRRLLQTALERLARYQIDDAADLLVQALYPLPPIDPHTFASEVRQCLMENLIAMENPGSSRWERSGTGMWLDVLDVAAANGVSVPLETATLLQTFCVYSDLASRLSPTMKVLPAFRRYRRRSVRRRARRLERRSRAGNPDGGNRIVHRPDEVGMLVSNASLWMQPAGSRSAWSGGGPCHRTARGPRSCRQHPSACRWGRWRCPSAGSAAGWP